MTTNVIAMPKAPGPSSSTETDESGRRAGYFHSTLCQLALPKARTSQRMVTWRSGRASVILKAGAYFDGRQMVDSPLPFGAGARLVLIHACAEAVRTGNREIEVGHSARRFLNSIGVACSRKEITAFRRQMLALASIEILLGMPSTLGPLTIKASPVEGFSAWLAHEMGQPRPWPGTLELGQRFFETLIENAVPLSPAALAHLKSSSLALDVYAWLAHRLCHVRRATVTVSWAELQEQFGCDDSDLARFRRRFLVALTRVQAVYRDAKVSPSPVGLRLYGSPPPIARSGVVVALPFKGNGGRLS